jgi:hypothetical protein
MKTKMKSRDRRLKSQLDKLVSELVRRRDDGVCYTCNTKRPWKEMQCGHYVKRGCWRLRFDLRNLHCQCPRCNMYLGGNMDNYAVHLIKDYGIEILDELQRLKNMPEKKWKVAELEQMILETKKRLKDYE